MPKNITVSVTGHRPNKLWGYSLSDPHYVALQRRFEEELVRLGCTDAWTGMALGADTVFARAVLALRGRGVPVRLRCAVPCLGQSSRWSADSVREYDRILGLADEVRLVTDAPYAPRLMQVRNEFMVDRADAVLALWNGTPGGTGNCVRYARSRNVPVIVVDPAEIA